jgi:Ca2+/Na+ antiporter
VGNQRTVQSAAIILFGAVGGALAAVVGVAVVLIVVVAAVMIVTKKRKPNHQDATEQGTYIEAQVIIMTATTITTTEFTCQTVTPSTLFTVKSSLVATNTQ